MTFLPDRSRLRAVLASAALSAVAASAALAADEEIVLRIDGAPGTPFTATCEVNSAASGKTVTMIDEKLPFKTTFSGSGLRCSVTAASKIEVEAVKGGSRSFSGTSGGAATVKVGS